MGLISPTLPTTGQARGSEEVDVLNTLTALVNLVNGNLDDANMAAAGLTSDSLITALAQQLGVSDSGAVRRGKSIIATEETRTVNSYATLTTPDRVQNVVLPTNGLLFVAYQAEWKASAGAVTGRAAIFLGANQLKESQAGTNAAPVAQSAASGGTADQWKPLSTEQYGLVTASGSVAYTGDVTTGQALGATGEGPTWGGGACIIFAAAGTYDVSIQFLCSSGTVSVKNRKLWVWTMDF